MSINIGIKPIVKDGLVLHLDPASPKNYTLSEVEVLVVGGGGGGSYNVYDDGAGGGGGGVLYSSSYKVTPGNGITVTVGNGGAAGNSIGSRGQNSIFGNLIAQGGGGGQGHRSSTHAGANGGSGGGSGGQYSNDSNAPGEGTVGQGHRGGHSISYAGGGGGGAGSPGNGALSWQVGGNGGDGLPFDISGKLRYYGGGGGGYPKTNYNGLGGKGGGGDTYVAGTPNTGGGGGGGKAGSASLPIGAPGGSGIVIVRYPGPQKATGGNTIENINGYTIHTFTASGTFTPLNIPVNAGSVYGLQDLTGKSATATATDATYDSSTKSFVFNGSSSGVQLVHNSSWVLVPSDKFSLSVWFYPEASQNTEGAMIFSHQRCNNPGIQLFYNNSNNNFTFRISGNTNIFVNYTLPSAGAWYHATATFDGIENMKVYINGSLVSTGVNGGGWSSYVEGNSEVWLGKRYPCGLTDNLNGKIGSFQYYKGKELSLLEVQQNFNALRGRFGI